jgi:acetyl-CoA C-acetyltransferase
MADALIIDACRTPRGIGKAGKGALSGIHPQQLGATVLRALAERTAIDTADVDDIVWGTAAQLGSQSGDLGRMSALDAGYDVRASGVTLDRFCGSGITSVAMAAHSIMAGSEDLVIAGGTEMMSMEGRRGSGPFIMDAGNLRLRARHPQSHQGVCADAIATMEGITRADVDQLGLESQKRAAHAIANGYFNKSLVPVHREDGGLALDKEEYPRPQTTLEGLAALKPAFWRSPTTRSTTRGRPIAISSCRSIRGSRSITCITPAIRPAWWTARPRSCWLRQATPGRMA